MRSSGLVFILLCACELAPPERASPVLVTLSGVYDSPEEQSFDGWRTSLAEAGVVDPEVRVVLSWFRFRGAVQGDLPWIAAEATVLAKGNAFSLDVHSVPPSDALIPIEEARFSLLNNPSSGVLAFGVLSAVYLSEEAEGFQWSQTSEIPARMMVIGHELRTIVLFWAGPEPLQVEGVEAAVVSIPQGFSRLELQSPVFDGQTYTPRAVDDIFVDIGLGPPEWVFCEAVTSVDGQFCDISLGEFPVPGGVDCKCGPVESYFTRQRRALGLLCYPGIRQQVFAPSPLSQGCPQRSEIDVADWPCRPDGQSCEVDGHGFCSASGDRYVCREDLTWAIDPNSRASCSQDCDGGS